MSTAGAGSQSLGNIAIVINTLPKIYFKTSFQEHYLNAVL